MEYSVYCPACECRFTSHGLPSRCQRCLHEGVQAKPIDPEEVRKQLDLRMAKGEIPWPGGELLPVKFSQDPKKAGLEMPRLGLLVKGKGPVVVFANLFDVIQNPSIISAANSKTYPSFEAMLDDGWRVD